MELGVYDTRAEAVVVERVFRERHGIKEYERRKKMKFVTMHLPSGDFPALVIRENPDSTLNLTVFIIHDTVYRDMVHKYEEKVDSEPEDKYGFYSA